jgi:dUTP pyrophosphatase
MTSSSKSASSKSAWSNNFLKDHPSLPPGLLHDDKKLLPCEMQGLGDFVQYDHWAQVKCDPNVVPKRKTLGSAGHDLYSTKAETIPAGGSAIFDTGVSIALPTQHYGKIEGQSSLGFTHNIVAFGGIIDEDYQGAIKVKLFNHGLTDYTVNKHDCIAQMVVQKYSAPSFQPVSTFSNAPRGKFGAIGDHLTSSMRTNGGFGSTGK